MNTIPDSTPQKQCTACLIFFPATTEFFWISKQGSHGLKSICKQCYGAAKRSARGEIPSQQFGDTSYKQCSKCKTMLPETPDFFTRHVGGKNGLSACCKECKNSARRKTRIEKDHIAEGMKQCSICIKILPATPQFFTRHPQKSDGLNPVCKSCRNMARRGNKVAREYQLRYEKEHRKDISNKARMYRDAHKEHINAQHRQRLQTTEGKVLKRAARLRRKARKMEALGTLTAQEIQMKLKAQKHRCYYAACGHSKFHRVNGKYVYHVEHTVPLSRIEEGPRHDVNFVVLSCPECNMRKGSKLPHEFFEGGRLC